jgi:hypothetical protein
VATIIGVSEIQGLIKHMGIRANYDADLYQRYGQMRITDPNLLTAQAISRAT